MFLSLLSIRMEGKQPTPALDPSRSFLPRAAELSIHWTISSQCPFKRVTVFLFPSPHVPLPTAHCGLFPLSLSLYLHSSLLSLSFVKQTGSSLSSLLPCNSLSFFAPSDPLVIHFRGCQPYSSCRMQPARFICHCLSGLH